MADLQALAADLLRQAPADGGFVLASPGPTLGVVRALHGHVVADDGALVDHPGWTASDDEGAVIVRGPGLRIDMLLARGATLTAEPVGDTGQRRIRFRTLPVKMWWRRLRPIASARRAA